MVFDGLKNVTGVVYKDVKYNCFTLDDSREIAYKLFKGKKYEELYINSSKTIDEYKQLVLVYKQDSVTAKLILNQINSKLTACGIVNKDLNKELDKIKDKIKRRNIALWITIPTVVIETVAIIKLLIKK